MKNSIYYLIVIFLIIGCEAPINETKKVILLEKEGVNVEVEKGLTDSSEEAVDTLSIEMLNVLDMFYKTIEKNDCQLLIQHSDFPITGDCGFYRMMSKEGSLNEEDILNDTTWLIDEELFTNHCTILTEIERETILQYRNKNFNGVQFDGCIYKTTVGINENYNSFYLSVGCVELLHDSVGEGSILFTFTKIDGVFKLKQIKCIG